MCKIDRMNSALLMRTLIAAWIAVGLTGCSTSKTSMKGSDGTQERSPARKKESRASKGERPISMTNAHPVPAPVSVADIISNEAQLEPIEAAKEPAGRRYIQSVEGSASSQSSEASQTPASANTSTSTTPAVATESVSRVSIPVEMNEAVNKWIKYFSVNDRERFYRFLKRGEQYRHVVSDVLEEHGLPAELYYLAMIESGYQTHAASHASAVGVWQFMRGTSVRYDLQTDRFVDERRDPIRATEAAAKYLTDLYNIFQSWHLAMAAYNAGEHRILNAVMRGKSRDFWTLAKKGVLPKETMDYVPKFLAALAIGTEPEKYGFNEIEAEKYPNLEAVEVPSPIRLNDVASVTGIPASLLMKVNPHIKMGFTPPNTGSYEIWVPAEKAEEVVKLKPQLAKSIYRGVKPSVKMVEAKQDWRVTPAQPRDHHNYLVRKGDTLAAIAQKHHISIGQLKRLNALRTNDVFAGTRLRVSAKSYRASLRYKVRRGDNLNEIASRFGLTVDAIKKLNQLRQNKIYIGQTLKVN